MTYERYVYQDGGMTVRWQHALSAFFVEKCRNSSVLEATARREAAFTALESCCSPVTVLYT